MDEREKLNALLSKTPLSTRMAKAFRARPPPLSEEDVIRALLDKPL